MSAIVSFRITAAGSPRTQFGQRSIGQSLYSRHSVQMKAYKYSGLAASVVLGASVAACPPAHEAFLQQRRRPQRSKRSPDVISYCYEPFQTRVYRSQRQRTLSEQRRSVLPR